MHTEICTYIYIYLCVINVSISENAFSVQLLMGSCGRQDEPLSLARRIESGGRRGCVRWGPRGLGDVNKGILKAPGFRV